MPDETLIRKLENPDRSSFPSETSHIGDSLLSPDKYSACRFYVLLLFLNVLVKYPLLFMAHADVVFYEDCNKLENLRKKPPSVFMKTAFQFFGHLTKLLL